VSGGTAYRLATTSSNPATATSSGTRSPRCQSTLTAPTAMESVKQKNASGGSCASRNVRTPSTAASVVHRGTVISSDASSGTPAASSACRYPSVRCRAAAVSIAPGAPTTAMRRRPVASRCSVMCRAPSTLSTPTWSVRPWITSPMRTVGGSGPRASPTSSLMTESSSDTGLSTSPSTSCDRARDSRSRSRRGSAAVSSICTLQPRACPSSTKWCASSAEYAVDRSGSASAISPYRPLRRPRAPRFGT